MTFYLGTDRPQWLSTANVPLFVSRRVLAGRKTLPKAYAPWALDSGAFTELDLHGRHVTEPRAYADEAMRFQAEIGRLDFAAIQDWMCEPFMVEKTGKSVREHQELTIKSYLDLRELAPSVPWIPVLQGWKIPDYIDHAAQYERAGVDLSSLPRVGAGSVCRRQKTWEAVELFADLRHLHLRLHGFGLKISFLKQVFRCGLESFDSMAWSLRARREGKPLMPGCTHKTCSHCLRFALAWRDDVCRIGRRPGQPLLI